MNGDLLLQAVSNYAKSLPNLKSDKKAGIVSKGWRLGKMM